MKKVSDHSHKKTFFNPTKTVIAFGLLLVSVFVTTAFVQQSQDVRQRAQLAPTPTPVNIDIVDFQYNPGTVTVQVGTRVTWTNRSTQNVPHTTTSDVSGSPQSWDSQIISPGGTFSKVFDTPGTYGFHCNVHGVAMSGQIIVTSQPPPTSSVSTAPTSVIPTYTCLGACPTPSPYVTPTSAYKPTPTPTPKPYYPTATPTPYRYPSPTKSYKPTPTVKPYVSPTRKPTATPKPTAVYYPPTATPTTDPCPVDAYATANQDHNAHATSVAESDSNRGFMGQLLEFILRLFFRLLEILFGYGGGRPNPYPEVTPTPGVYPTAAVSPTSSYPEPTSVPSPTDPYATIAVSPTTYYPEPTTVPSPTTPYVSPTTSPCVTVSPTQAPTTVYYPTATPTVPYYPTPTATPAYPTPTTAPGYPTPTATPVPAYPTNTATPPTPTPTVKYGRSVDSFQYVDNNEPLKEYNLTAEVVGNQWLFNKSLPGPVIEANQGDHLRINLHNLLPEALTVHWHGIMLPASQDGVAGVTQNAVKPGETYTYNYVVPDVGTYWYHSHQNTSQQLPKGLFGALIVSPKQAEPYDRDYPVIYRNTTSTTEQFTALPGEKVRVRLTNSRVGDSAGTPVIVAPIGVPFKVIALDGQNINAPQEISSQLLHIGFAQRYDIEFTMPASGMVQIADKENLQTLNFGTGDLPVPGNLNTLPVFSFMDYGEPTADVRLPRDTFDAEQTLEIGPNLTINGKLGHEIPDMIVKEGQIAKIKYVNNSNMTHPMHLHGHFYSVISFNGKKPTGSPIHLDTILLAPGDVAEVAFLADNPGVWMLHCHILAHAAAGLSMMVTYDGVYTPYEIGGTSGNKPE